MTYVRLSGPKDRRSPRLRPTIEQDVDLSAVSVVVDVSSADGRQQCPSNGRQRTLEYGPLNPAGSGPKPSCIKHENQQSVARCNLRNWTNLRSRPCVGLERDMVCTAPWKAWQTTERGLRQSRTPHARSSCIIGHFLTIAWRTQILAIGDSQVRSYDRRTVSVEWSVRRANCKRFTHIRPTDGSGSRPVSWSGERLSMAVHGQTRMLNAPAVSTSFGSLPFILRFSLKQNTQLSTVNRFEASPESSRLGTDCIVSKLTRRSNARALFRIRSEIMRLLSHCRA